MGDQYEECSFEEATHARLAGGKVVELKRDANPSYARWKDFGTFLSNKDFEDLGITPLREVEVKPIEFVAEVLELNIHDLTCGNIIAIPDSVYAQVKEGMKFKCVQILGDEE